VHPAIGLDFATALRAFLRGDPDIIMVGEMRDSETAKSAFEASLTGHLVFSTVHTNSAADTVVRVLDLGIDTGRVASGLLGVLGQRLVRTLCESCKQPYHVSDSEYDWMEKSFGDETFAGLGFEFPELEFSRGALELFKAGGCKECTGTGYRGRLGVHELLVVSKEIKELLLQGASPDALEALAMRQGMRTILQDAICKVCQGFTDFEQVQRVIDKS